MSKLEIIPTYSVGNITIDFDQLKAECREMVARYKDLYIDDSQVKSAKKDLAELRKKKKEINDQKIKIKKAYMKPFEDFENGCKELIQIIDESVANLDTQVKRYEFMEKQQKREAMEKYWSDTGIDWVPFDVVFTDELLNKSVTEKQWKEHFDNFHLKLQSDQILIESMDEEKKLFMQADYKRTFNVSESLMNWKQYSERQAEIQALQAEKKEEPVEIIIQDSGTNFVSEQPVKELETRTYTVTATKEQHEAIVNFFERNNIDWLPF